MVEVHYVEGVAIHNDPEPCRYVREGSREASVGECIGQVIEPRKGGVPGADAVRSVEGKTDGRDIASARTARRGQRPWHVQTLFVREPGDLVSGRWGYAGPCREGEEP